MKHPQHKFASVLISLLLSLLMTAPAFAVEPGDLELKSRQNEPLHATFDIINIEAQSKYKVRLASESRYQDFDIAYEAAFDSIKLEEEKNGSRSVVHIRSRTPIAAEKITLLLELLRPDAVIVAEFPVFVTPPKRTADYSYVPTLPIVDGAPQFKTGNDTVYSVARQLKPEGVTTRQMMVALLIANPDAFFNYNLNGLRKDAVLKVPALDDVRSVSRAESARVFSKHRELWRRKQAAEPPRKFDTGDGILATRYTPQIQVLSPEPLQAPSPVLSPVLSAPTTVAAAPSSAKQNGDIRSEPSGATATTTNTSPPQPALVATANAQSSQQGSQQISQGLNRESVADDARVNEKTGQKQPINAAITRSSLSNNTVGDTPATSATAASTPASKLVTNTPNAPALLAAPSVNSGTNPQSAGGSAASAISPTSDAAKPAKSVRPTPSEKELLAMQFERDSLLLQHKQLSQQLFRERERRSKLGEEKSSMQFTVSRLQEQLDIRDEELTKIQARLDEAEQALVNEIPPAATASITKPTAAPASSPATGGWMQTALIGLGALCLILFLILLLRPRRTVMAEPLANPPEGLAAEEEVITENAVQESLPLPEIGDIDDESHQAELILEIPNIPIGLIDDDGDDNDQEKQPDVAEAIIPAELDEDDAALDDLVVDLAAYIEERETVRAKKDLPVLEQVVAVEPAAEQDAPPAAIIAAEDGNLSAAEQANVKINLAHIFADIGDLDEARTMLRDVVRSGPEDHRREAAELLQALG